MTSPDPWMDYWWPKVLAECEEYHATVRLRRWHRIEAAVCLAGITAVGSLICLAVLNAESTTGAMAQLWHQMIQPPTYSSVEVPYT